MNINRDNSPLCLLTSKLNDNDIYKFNIYKLRAYKYGRCIHKHKYIFSQGAHLVAFVVVESTCNHSFFSF